MRLSYYSVKKITWPRYALSQALYSFGNIVNSNLCWHLITVFSVRVMWV